MTEEEKLSKDVKEAVTFNGYQNVVKRLQLEIIELKKECFYFSNLKAENDLLRGILSRIRGEYASHRDSETQVSGELAGADCRFNLCRHLRLGQILTALRRWLG